MGSSTLLSRCLCVVALSIDLSAASGYLRGLIILGREAVVFPPSLPLLSECQDGGVVYISVVHWIGFDAHLGPTQIFGTSTLCMSYLGVGLLVAHPSSAMTQNEVRSFFLCVAGVRVRSIPSKYDLYQYYLLYQVDRLVD